MSNDFNPEHDLFTPERWPLSVLRSSHFPFLKKVSALALQLDGVTAGDADLDAELQTIFTKFSRLVPSIPDPEAGRPAYNRLTWDLRAITRMIPANVQLELKQDSLPDPDGDCQWHASLFQQPSPEQGHASLLPQNASLFYGSSNYGIAWTPNVAITRILLAGFILGVIQRIQSGTVGMRSTDDEPTARLLASA